jgi:hypothetical protein
MIFNKYKYFGVFRKRKSTNNSDDSLFYKSRLRAFFVLSLAGYLSDHPMKTSPTIENRF